MKCLRSRAFSSTAQQRGDRLRYKGTGRVRNSVRHTASLGWEVAQPACVDHGLGEPGVVFVLLSGDDLDSPVHNPQSRSSKSTTNVNLITRYHLEIHFSYSHRWVRIVPSTKKLQQTVDSQYHPRSGHNGNAFWHLFENRGLSYRAHIHGGDGKCRIECPAFIHEVGEHLLPMFKNARAGQTVSTVPQ